MFFPALFLFTGSAGATEMISDFSVQIKINNDSSLDVSELISYDFGEEEKHGIIREIPYKYKNEHGKRKLDITPEGVYANGQEADHSVSKEGDSILIKIGDRKKTVSGKQEYEIRYKVEGAINFFEEHDELYWNITGHKWEADIMQSKAEITLPAPVLQRELKTECFAGEPGSKDKCVSKRYIFSGRDMVDKIVFADDKLTPGKGATLVVGLPKGMLEKPSVFSGLSGFGNLVVLMIPLLVLAAMLYLWYTRGRDPIGRRVIVAEFSPPKGMGPAAVGTLVDEKTHRKDISAEMINLAINGYIKISRLKDKGVIIKKTDFLLEKLKDSDGLENQYEKMILDLLFKKSVKIKNVGDFFKLLSEKGKIPEDEKTGWKKLSDFYLAAFGVPPEQAVNSREVIKLSGLENDFYTEVKKITDEIYKDLTFKGYFKSHPGKTAAVYISIGAVILVAGFFAGPLLGPLGLPALMISGVIIMIFGKFMPAKTEKGVKAKEHILGLKRYLSVAEKDRLKFHNSPSKDPKVFEKLLPYAIVLGVEKEWARQFEGIYDAQPAWYGDSQGARFSSLLLISNLSSFKTAANSIYAAAPSGKSGFSGGASGGGFGGGGGRSW
jgi:uncharacterized membrane protein